MPQISGRGKGRVSRVPCARALGAVPGEVRPAGKRAGVLASVAEKGSTPSVRVLRGRPPPVTHWVT